jgi:GDP-L-fucose synthase
VQDLLFFSSACVYPRLCPQPMREEQLWTGPVEPTNEPYAVAKLAGMSMCRAYNDQYGTRYLSVIPTNLYGPNDNFDPDASHVLAALLLKFHRAKTSGESSVTLWGTGSPRRDLMYVDDAAEGSLKVLADYRGRDAVNIGTGTDHTIRELAELVGAVVGYTGAIEFDATRPDGAPRKMLDASRLLALGWTPSVDLRSGVERTYEWFLQHGIRP